MRWLVCGGRDFGNIPRRGWRAEHTQEYLELKKKEYRLIFSKLEELASKYLPSYPSEELQLPSGIEIISGMAAGADSVALDWSIVNGLPCHEFPADWDKHGRSAGYIRNKQMLDEGKPDLVVAFPGGKGTEMMIRLAKEAGIPVTEYGRR